MTNQFQQPNPYAPQAQPRKKRRVGLWIALGVVVLLIGGCVAAVGGGSSTTPAPVATSGGGASEAPASEPTKADEPASKEDAVPAEHKAALKSADTYANRMHMSKQAVYDQLVSEYGGKFPAEAAQYAIDNVKADWNRNALESAKTYQDMGMSKQAIHDQLTSEYGGKFEEAEADYAIANL